MGETNTEGTEVNTGTQATPKLDAKGLEQVWAAIVKLFAPKELIEAIQDKLDGVAEGAQVNIIEGVQVNGVDLQVSEDGKKVNILVPDTYTKTETDAAIKAAVDTAVTNVYKFQGSILFTALPTEGMRSGDVYNIKEPFTTTGSFVEGAGRAYPAGTNVAYTDNGWDCMAGVYDFSNFVQKSELTSIPESEIKRICVLPGAEA